MLNNKGVSSFLSKIEHFILKHQLMNEGEKYLMALSGGADSMALMTAIHYLGYNIEAAHCNFHLRGEESDRDEHFCIEQCQRLGIQIHLAHFDTNTYAKSHKVSIEMAARELRYSFFEHLRNDLGAKGVLVAHHKDDSVETVLMNLIRGTGVHGLTGISPRHGYIIRPLLCVDRCEIEAFVRENDIPYVTDSSNMSDDVVRNKIRLDVLPLLRTINPSASDSIFNTSQRLSQVATVFDKAIQQEINEALSFSGERETIYAIEHIKSEYALFYILQPCSFTPEQIEEIYTYLTEQHTTGRLFLSSTHELLVDRGKIIIQPQEKLVKPFVIPETGNYVMPNEKRLTLKKTPIDDSFIISRKPGKVCLDADCVQFPLTLRPTSIGDRFCPLGMKGSRLVSDFLTDQKKTIFEKRRQWIVEDATGKIIWVVGLRPDDRCRLTPNSKTALILELTNSSN